MNKSCTILRLRWSPTQMSIRHHKWPQSFIHFMQSFPGTQYTKLMNGLTVATEERESSNNACIGLYIDAGSRYETPQENGTAHFFEHMVYKGTNCRSKYDLETCITNIGASFRSFTTREMVCYYAECLKSDVPIVTEILTDCVFNNTCLKADIEFQKCVAYAEMLEHDDDSNRVLYDRLHSAAFQGTPLANTIMGPSCNLYNIETHTIQDYIKKWFDPTRMVLAAVGGIKHDQVVCLANTFLQHLMPVKNPDNNVYRYTGSEIRCRDDTMPLGNVIIAVEGPPWCEDDNIVMELAKYITGSWDRSQVHGDLLPWVAAKGACEGLCDSYKSFNINYKDTGLWGVQYIGDVLHLDDMCLLIQNQWMYLCNCVTEPEVERAKNFLMSKILIELQSTRKLCHDVGRWTLYNGCRPSILERLTAIERVQAKDVREVCTRYIYNKCPIVVAVGKIEGLNNYCNIRNGMYWLRI